MFVSSIKTFDYKVRSLTPVQQALTVIFCLLTTQYIGNFLAYSGLLPIVFGKDLNGILRIQRMLFPEFWL